MPCFLRNLTGLAPSTPPSLPQKKKNRLTLLSAPNGQKWTYKAINKQRFTPSPAFQHKDGFTLGRRWGGRERKEGKMLEKFLRVN